MPQYIAHYQKLLGYTILLLWLSTSVASAALIPRLDDGFSTTTAENFCRDYKAWKEGKVADPPRLLFDKWDIIIPADYLSFLGLAQGTKLPFLPVVSESQKIGEGAGSAVSKATFRQTSLAFKKFKADPAIYTYAQRELLVLTHPGLRNSQYIVKPKGVTFQLTTEPLCRGQPNEPWSLDKPVQPIILTELAPYGSLDQLMTAKPEKRAQAWDNKVRMCRDIGRGIQDMHSVKLFHKDLKPDNIAVFYSGDATHPFLPKLIDFELAEWEATVPGRVQGSGGLWTPPENLHGTNGKGQSLENAQKQDIWSWGMICAWIFFDDLRTQVNAPKTRRAIRDAANDLGKEATIRQKLGGDVDHDSVKILASFFAKALNPDVSKRESDIKGILKVFDSPSEAPYNSPRGQFKPMKDIVKDYAHSLPDISTDYSILQREIVPVRRQIAQLLAHVLEPRPSKEESDESFLILTHDREQCQTCKPNSAFQLAICYETGFGTTKDHARAMHMLGIAGKSAADLRAAVAKAATNTPSSMYLELNPTNNNKVILNDGPGQYKKWGLVREVKQTLGHEIAGKMNSGTAIGEVTVPILQHIDDMTM